VELSAQVHAHIAVELPIPKMSKRRTAAALAGAIRPTSRPDIDNYLKSALDAVNGIVVVDDSMIVEIGATKRFSTGPKITITITPLRGTEPSNRRVVP
jgi:Holliday junction resolvase RusA-like endonuclease